MSKHVATRAQVYEALDTERAYQDSKWNFSTTTSGGEHSLSEWFAYITDYVREAQHLLARNARQKAYPEALEIMRKVGGMAVCAMEQHGAPKREVS